ncbi:HAMP domain-containing histidine kinase [Candidatus Parcubacteria bacterium]|nr:HAMP domain-containing histidine kinase [Candidatus Parcubacteria bacterium]
METKNKICNALNPVAACRKYEVPLWQCPQFLFLIMGLVILVAILAIYFLGTNKIKDPAMMSLLVIGITGFLLLVSFIITSSLERLADASRMKTEFINIVSHQLRAPLTNLKFSLDFLTSQIIPQSEASREEYYVILKENTQRMGDLIDNLLTVSRISAGKFPLRKEDVSLGELIDGLLNKFKPFIAASNIQVNFQREANVPQVTGDRLWLEQVMENLLDNAIKYTKGGGAIAIKLKQKNKKIYFEIKDTGVGIPKEEQKFVFERFFRSKNALKEQTRGSGLGLHIVKKVIELSNGKIGFSSKEGKGTTFYFTLPIKKL